MKRVKKTVVKKSVAHRVPKPIIIQPTIIVKPVLTVIEDKPVVTPTVTERTLPPHMQTPLPEISLANGPLDEKSEYNLPMLLVVGVVIIVVAIAFWVANAHPHGF